MNFIDVKPKLLPRVLGTAVKIETSVVSNDTSTAAGVSSTGPKAAVPQKKVFKTVEYKLKCKHVKPRKFTCVGCNESFNSQRELNDHFRNTHPPVKCDLCLEYFDTLATMLQHKYKHYEFMFECKVCDHGFQFLSQLREHMRVHQSQGDWVCFKPKCGKHFKWESELNAHLLVHNKVQLQCDQCPYHNPDPRNLRAHKQRHDDSRPFKCAQCGKRFKWVQQRKRHLKSGTCPGPKQ